MVCLAGCSDKADPVTRFAQVDQERITHADAEPQNWFTTGRTFGEERFSPLTQIHSGNIKQLGFAWQLDLHTHSAGSRPHLSSSTV